MMLSVILVFRKLRVPAKMLELTPEKSMVELAVIYRLVTLRSMSLRTRVPPPSLKVPP